MQKFKIIFLFLYLFYLTPIFAESELDRLTSEYNSDPNRKWWLVRDIGLEYGKLGNYSESAKYLEIAKIDFRKNKPSENTGYFIYHLGLAYLELNQISKAISTLETAISEKPPEPDRSAIYRLLEEAYIDGIDEIILSKRKNLSAQQYILKVSEIPDIQEITKDDIQIRKYLLNSTSRRPNFKNKSTINLTAQGIFCEVLNSKLSNREKLKFKNHASLYAMFISNISSEQVKININFRDSKCSLDNFSMKDNITFPNIESAKDLEAIHDWVSQTYHKTDIYIIAHSYYPESKGSTSYGYRMPLSNNQRAPGRNRINFQGSRLIVWIHEFHHSIASAMWPKLGEAHRFMNESPLSPNKSILPCQEKDHACLTTRPSWIKGKGEADYYIELYRNMEKLGGWKQLGNLSINFEKFLQETGKISTED
jgi:tetratricopeptide (TPR) repeat protein